MTPEQFERWKEFSVRMARTCFEGQQNPDPDWIVDVVEDFFWRLNDGDVITFESWDDSTQYPRETGYFSDRPCPCRWRKPDPPPPCARHDAWTSATDVGLSCDQADAYVAWLDPPPCTCPNSRPSTGPGAPDPECEECGGDPRHRQMSTGPYVCDIMSENESEAYPGGSPDCDHCRTPYDREARWRARAAGLDDEVAKRYARWRSEPPWWHRCTCWEDDDAAFERWSDRWYGPVRCCVRAGIDFAAGPSAGVIGFTAGDVRNMYPEGVPEWVFSPDERLGYWLSDQINGTFPELPDHAHVVL